LYEQTNQLDAAISAIRECVAQAPDQAEPKLVLARIERERGQVHAAESLLNELCRTAGAAPLLYVRSWTELCYLRDAQADYAGAIAAIENAKQILRQSPQIAPLLRRNSQANEMFRRLYAELTRDDIDAWRRVPLEPDARCAGIAHLLGFPRSGTTLLEQILTAHPHVVGSPERGIFAREIFPAMYRQEGVQLLTIDSLRGISSQHLSTLRTRYLDYMEAILGEPLAGRIHLDKNPNHTSLVAGLMRLFPESRFVFALRDPRDVIVSCYLRFFPLSEFSVAFLTWEGCCGQYVHDMHLWRSVRELMTDNWQEVRYEDVVADPLAASAPALHLLGLAPSDAVADYRRQAEHKVVNSPSQADVRRPIFTQSIGRWRHYQQYLEPILGDLEPYCRMFGYV
jgi:hypothetical protein